jgi:hypothetical protein
MKAYQEALHELSVSEMEYYTLFKSCAELEFDVYQREVILEQDFDMSCESLDEIESDELKVLFNNFYI